MIDNFKQQYVDMINKGLDSINNDSLSDAVDIIENAILNFKDIFVCGNGGSAAIAEHLSCDHSKGISTNTALFPRVHCLVSNMSLLTALANDVGYEEIFAAQLGLQARKDDVLIVISSSGNSPNVLRALDVANALQMKTITFTGFDGGKASYKSNINLHVPINNYGVVEDCHQILMHIIAQHIRTTQTVVDLKNVKL